MLERVKEYPNSTLPEDRGVRTFRASPTANFSLDIEKFRTGSMGLWIWDYTGYTPGDTKKMGLPVAIAPFCPTYFDATGTAFARAAFDDESAVEPLLDYVREQFPETEPAIEALLEGR